MSNDNSKLDFAFTKENYVMMAIGCGIVLIGYLLMMGGGTDDPNEWMGGTAEEPGPLFNFQRITLAPIMVLIGYIFVIYAIMKKPKPKA